MTVFADDLLDEVLSWDKPVASPTPAARTPAIPKWTEPSPANANGWNEPSMPSEAMPSTPDMPSMPQTPSMPPLRERPAAPLGAETPYRPSAPREERTGPVENTPETDDGDGLFGVTLSARYGNNSLLSFATAAELMIPLGNMPVALSIRGMFLNSEIDNDKDGYDFDAWKIEGQVLWQPFRGNAFSPFAGLGLGYDYSHYMSYASDDLDDRCTKDGASFRVGFDACARQMMFRGEYIASPESSELVGLAGLRLTRHLWLNGFIESVTVNNSPVHAETVAGGGGTIKF